MNAFRLLGIEWFKMSRSFAFRAAMLFFVGLLLLNFGADYYFATQRPPASVERALSESAGILSAVGMLLMLILVVLLTGNEKTWRTERQNVIDGLSRDEYFGGKLLLLMTCALILWTTAATVDTVFTALQRRMTVPADAFLTTAELLRFGEMFIYLLLVGAIGLLFAMITSSSGAGLALSFLFLLLQLPLVVKLVSMGGAWQESASYLPVQVMAALGSGTNDAELLLRQNTMARERGGMIMLSTTTNVLLALAYATAFVAGGWVTLRRRDL
jgi:ABC-2 type transport system permease protein